MYIVYHVASTMEASARSRFTYRKVAERRVAELNARFGEGEYATTDINTYLTKVVYTKKVRNLLSGKEVEIASNTPLCCDPSSETYWSS